MSGNISIGGAEHARDWVDYATLVFTLATLVVVARYTQYAKKQSKAAEKTNELSAASLEMSRQSLDQSRQAFETSQRARLIVREFEFGEVRTGPFLAAAHVMNTGPLAATEVRMQARLVCGNEAKSVLLNDVPPPIRHDSVFEFSKDTIGSGSVSTIEATTELDDAVLGRGVNVIMFIGRVQYLDGFGTDRTLRFCRFWNSSFTPRRWTACFRHNWTD